VKLNPHIAAMPGAVYSRFAKRLAQFDGPTFPLHLGDTWMEPAVGCRLEDLAVEHHAGLHRYASVHGLPQLRRALAERVSARTGLPTLPEQVQVTAGATGGLTGAGAALRGPGGGVCADPRG
jgi:aspartate/methionine/tyrosine aminotransferase